MGTKACTFCGQDESGDHLFSCCSVATLIYSSLQCAFNLTPVSLLIRIICFGAWPRSFSKKHTFLVTVGITYVFLGCLEMRKRCLF